MKIKVLLIVCFLTDLIQYSTGQNLILNPGAEGSPSGTLWTVLTSGGTACAAGTAAGTYSNWTMTPDNSVNYPVAHGGTKTFFAGCSATVPGGPFELYQDINVTADATQIDAGSVTYNFSGFIQTPVSPQADAGRFIVDFMNAGGVVTGVSYTSAYQSFAAGSGGGWVQYTNSRKAPTGTRKLRIRLQTTIATGPAINAYFDDIALTKSVTLPVVMVSFTGTVEVGKINLKWIISDAVDFSGFEVEKGTDTAGFQAIGEVKYVPGQTEYVYNEKQNTVDSCVYYRLKLMDIDGKYDHSHILSFCAGRSTVFEFSPNPARFKIAVSGISTGGTIIIIDMMGNVVFQGQTNSNRMQLDISALRAGIYILSYFNTRTTARKKLIIQQ